MPEKDLNFGDLLNQWIGEAGAFMWGPFMVFLLLGTHLFLTFRLGFIQRFIPHGIKLSFTKEKDSPGDISPFGALTAALAATVGTGNIMGVGSAILIGGPGALFWMWITGVFGIATKFSEAVLSIKYRVQKEDGSFAGGPMYVLERGLGWKPLGVIFAIFTAIAAFGIGNMTQSNTISETVGEIVETAFQVEEGATEVRIANVVTGLVLAGLAAMVILGGVKAIARVCSFLVPIMAIIYALGCLIIIGSNISEVPATIGLILHEAFSGMAMLGGAFGVVISEAIRAGAARGIFSNEAGMGSAPIMAAAARTANPVRQGLVSASGVFWDTVVICALTGLAMLLAGDWQSEGVDKGDLAKSTFLAIPAIGPTILTVGLATFVFSTILGWSYYGEKAIQYLVGDKAILPYRVLWIVAVFLGAVLHSNPVWAFSDVMNACMAIPNLIALLLLHNVIARETKTHLKDLTGKD